MTAGRTLEPASAGGGLLGKLLAAVRPEFRVEVYLPAPDDPVLGRPRLRGARLRPVGLGVRAVRRALEPLAQPGPPGAGGLPRRPRPAAAGADRADPLHRARLPLRQQRVRVVHAPPQRLGPQRPPRPGGLGGRPTRSSNAVERAECGLPFCTLWCENDTHLFCKSHETRWRQLGRPAVEDYVAHCLLRGRARIDFRGLAPQPRLELQYAVQCRHDQQTITAPPPVVNWAIGQVSAAGVGSLLDHPREQWRALTAGEVRRLVSGVRPARPRRRRDAARGHRLGGRVPARRLAAAHPARADPQRRQGPRRPQPPAVRPHHPALAARSWPSAGPGCGCPAGSPWPPCSTTSAR